MEDVLSTLKDDFSQNEIELDSRQKEQKWKTLELKNNYDAGCMLAGMGDGEGSFHDFIMKFSSVLSTISKTRQKKPDQKILDLVKISLLIYLDSLDIKKDAIKDNASILSTIHGFVDQFVSNAKYESRL